jgi:Fe-S cluster assembly protein SufD
LPLPTEKDEQWRYSRIAELNLAAFAPANSPLLEPPALSPAIETLLTRIGDRSGLAVTRNGAVHRIEVAQATTDAGIHFGAGTDGTAGLFGRVAAQFPGTEDAYGALADAFTAHPVVLEVPAGRAATDPFVVLHVLDGAAGNHKPAYFPRTLVHAGEAAEATLIEILVSGGGARLVLPTVELSIDDGARLTHEVVQLLGPEAWQLGRLFAAAGRDASLKSFQASLGGHMARTDTKSILNGQGGSSQLLAAFFGTNEQVHDFRILQEHAGPRTTSDLVFKGAVDGRARSVYTGLIRMRHGARGASAFQTNRNLVLSEGAHADSVPNLDIQENDVRCSHASAVGPIDEEQRFYVESRGVPKEVAERLILLGHFTELLERVSAPVRQTVIDSIAGALTIGSAK